MKLAWKLLAAPALTALVVFTTGEVNALIQSQTANANRVALEAQLDDFRTLSSAQEQLAQIHTAVYRTLTLVASLDDGQVKKIRSDMAREVDGVKRVAAAVSQAHTDKPAIQSGLVELDKGLAKYLQQADQAVDLSSMDPNTGIAAMQNADETFKGLAQSIRSMLKQLETDTEAQLTAAAQHSSRIGWLMAGLGVLSAAVAVGLSALMQRKVTAELGRAAAIASEVAGGNLVVDARSERNDEVGDLLRALGSMSTQLAESMRTVLHSSDAIRNASSEIASGNQDLSMRTEQTAANLEEAASSMEDLTNGVKQSASSAAEANRLANSAAEVAARGGQVMAQVVATMEDINTSSRKIGDIVGVIDSIAFQTNILALNAAVEAARAGEQGRGFAVVASEVRSLAQRSALAAREIKTMINSSVEKVEGGSHLVADAGQTMSEIVSSVQHVSDIIGHIASAAGEQSDGIGTINASVVQLDQMTQQNAALVEQSAASAESLKEQASKLADVVHTFKLG
ncbi:methyl-accepting chemotaxis protein [Paucibacter sp. AS339]|uniref:methyl-accepting chemotaxis protein n=1 Tax=Paucibacter hankyongi TaxID=3133434 RepID=UPI0030A032A0